MLYVTMVYGPIAAFLVELFPTRIRYSSMSLPYHIGNGWFGGFLPFIAAALVVRAGGYLLRALVSDRRGAREPDRGPHLHARDARGRLAPFADYPAEHRVGGFVPDQGTITLTSVVPSKANPRTLTPRLALIHEACPSPSRRLKAVVAPQGQRERPAAHHPRE